MIGSGANIASSPKRLNTHTYDPAIAAIKVATTPYDARVDFKYIYKYIENIIVETGNINFKSENGILYNSDKTEIYAEYHVPSGVSITNANQNLSFTIKVGGYKKEITSDMNPEFEKECDIISYVAMDSILKEVQRNGKV